MHHHPSEAASLELKVIEQKMTQIHALDGSQCMCLLPFSSWAKCDIGERVSLCRCSYAVFPSKQSGHPVPQSPCSYHHTESRQAVLEVTNVAVSKFETVEYLGTSNLTVCFGIL